MLYGNPQLSGMEKTFHPDEIIVSKTNLAGKLTYANRTFYKLSGMSEKECIGKQHNIIRNPNMPRSIFDLLWKTIKGGEEIFAYVNNRSKNGDHYWVLAHVTPSQDNQGNIIGYHSNRRVPNKPVLNDKIVPLYQELLSIEKSSATPKEGLMNAYTRIDQLLNEYKMTFNELMFAMDS